MSEDLRDVEGEVVSVLLRLGLEDVVGAFEDSTEKTHGLAEWSCGAAGSASG